MGYLTYVGIQACVGQVSLFFCNMRCQLSFSTVLEDMHSLIFVLHAIFSCCSSIVIHLERIALVLVVAYLFVEQQNCIRESAVVEMCK